MDGCCENLKELNFFSIFQFHNFIFLILAYVDESIRQRCFWR